MTVKEFAAAMDVTYTTAIRWLNLNLVPGAWREEVFPDMLVWRIPMDAVQTMERPKAGAPKMSERKAKKKSKK